MASRRPSQRRHLSASTHHTKYSIDFDALRGPNSDASSLPEIPRHEPLDAIRSEEIDGPTDFTQNMEFWMRAPLTNIGTHQPNITEPVHIADTSVAEDIERYIDSDERESLLGEDGDLEEGEDRIEGDVTREEDDRLSEVSSLENQDRVLSYLETLPDAEMPSIHVDSPKSSATNRKAKSARSLQPTVEDAAETPRKASYGPITPPETEAHTPKSQQANQLSAITALQEQVLKQTSESNAIIKKLRESLAEVSEELKRSHNINAGYIKELESVRAEHQETIDRINSDWSSQVAAAKDAGMKELAELQESQATEMLMLQERVQVLEVRIEAERASAAISLEGARAEHSRELERRTEEFVAESSRQQEQISSLEGQLLPVKSEKQFSAEATRSSLAQEIELQAEDLGQKLITQQEQISRLQAQLQESRLAAESVLESTRASHKEELEQEKSGASAKISSLEEQLKDTQRNQATKDTSFLESSGVATSDPDSQARIAELDARLCTVNEQLEGLRKQLLMKDQEVIHQTQRGNHLEELYKLSKTKAADLEGSISSLREQLDQMRTEVHEARDEATTARTAARKEQDEHEHTRSQLSARQSEWERQREDLMHKQRQLQDTLSELQEEMIEKTTKHKTALDTLRTKAEDGIRKIGNLLEDERQQSKQARKDLEAAKQDLAKAQDARSSVQPNRPTAASPPESISQDTLRALHTALEAQKEATAIARAEADRAKLELLAFKEDNDAVNGAFDDRIQAFMREREKKWMERLQAALSERKQMGRALMQEWGREECGVAGTGEEQMYRYRFGRK